MKKQIIVIICIILAALSAGLFVPALSLADGVALAAVGLAVYAAVRYRKKRKKSGCNGCCGQCSHCGNCKQEE
ncbi:MAG: hypothetical protein NC085_08815 [Muribaculaceae bacterium]|nr:hypothetical protein [Muribaculaceae bacterium]MCM1479795.1 hypothetical protein [Muribaculaceae bacterium]